MIKTPLHRPSPLLQHNASNIDKHTAPKQAAERLRKGEQLLVTDHYGTGADILDQLRILLRPPSEQAPYPVRRAFQRTYRKLAMQLLVPIVDHRLDIAEAKHIGFFKELYPEENSFWLPFVQVQELYGAWNSYIEGIHFAVLGHKMRPFYGTYAPTRTSHLELFGTWLSQYKGARQRAVDVGTGCGVLALMLCKGKFEHVVATDNNPNAIESVAREIKRLPSKPPIAPIQCDLLAEVNTPPDLIVFNPPWMLGTAEGLIDGALYFEEGLFQRFFDQAFSTITPSSRIVLLFSNIMQLVQPAVPHPILTELERGRFRLVQKLNRKVKPTKTKDGKRRRTREKVEIWELAIA